MGVQLILEVSLSNWCWNHVWGGRGSARQRSWVAERCEEYDCRLRHGSILDWDVGFVHAMLEISYPGYVFSCLDINIHLHMLGWGQFPMLATSCVP